MNRNLPTEQYFLAKATPHLQRFKLGEMFPTYNARWSGENARSLASLIQEICWVLDHLGPSLLDEVCAQVREAAGLPAQRGMILMSYKKRSFDQMSYTKQTKPLCDALFASTAGDNSCLWSQEGCRNIAILIEDLIRKATKVMPAAIEKVRNTDPYNIPVSIE